MLAGHMMFPVVPPCSVRCAKQQHAVHLHGPRRLWVDQGVDALLTCSDTVFTKLGQHSAEMHMGPDSQTTQWHPHWHMPDIPTDASALQRTHSCTDHTVTIAYMRKHVRTTWRLHVHSRNHLHRYTCRPSSSRFRLRFVSLRGV